VKNYCEMGWLRYYTLVIGGISVFHPKHSILVDYIVFRCVNIVLSGFIIVLGDLPVSQFTTAI
jgi:hypothetical protein